MPAVRKALTIDTEGLQYVVRFKHPLSKKIVRWVMGQRPDEREAQTRLDKLNAVLLRASNKMTHFSNTD